MEIITGELRAGLPLELLYADDLILLAESEESLRDKIVKWKSGLEAKDGHNQAVAEWWPLNK